MGSMQPPRRSRAPRKRQLPASFKHSAPSLTAASPAAECGVAAAERAGGPRRSWPAPKPGVGRLAVASAVLSVAVKELEESSQPSQRRPPHPTPSPAGGVLQPQEVPADSMGGVRPPLALAASPAGAAVGGGRDQGAEPASPGSARQSPTQDRPPPSPDVRRPPPPSPPPASPGAMQSPHDNWLSPSRGSRQSPLQAPPAASPGSSGPSPQRASHLVSPEARQSPHQDRPMDALDFAPTPTRWPQLPASAGPAPTPPRPRRPSHVALSPEQASSQSPALRATKMSTPGEGSQLRPRDTAPMSRRRRPSPGTPAHARGWQVRAGPRSDSSGQRSGHRSTPGAQSPARTPRGAASRIAVVAPPTPPLQPTQPPRTPPQPGAGGDALLSPSPQVHAPQSPLRTAPWDAQRFRRLAPSARRSGSGTRLHAHRMLDEAAVRTVKWPQTGESPHSPSTRTSGAAGGGAWGGLSPTARSPARSSPFRSSATPRSAQRQVVAASSPGRDGRGASSPSVAFRLWRLHARERKYLRRSLGGLQ